MLEGLAGVAATHPLGREDFQRAVRLFGAAEALCESLGPGAWTRVSAPHAGELAAARAALGEAAYTAARAEGLAMFLEAAISFALGSTE